MFFKRRNKEEERNLFNELGVIHAKIVRFEAELDRLDQMIKNLRGIVNRKLGNVDKDDTENFNKSDGFSFLRGNKV